MVSVIILAFNRCAEALVTINKMQQLKMLLPFDMEIIVVDNASTDGTSVQISSLYPDVTLITRAYNNGIAGWNDGFAVARHKYFLVLDDDSHIENGLAEAVDFLEFNQDTGILGFNIVDPQLMGDPLLDPAEAWKHLQKIMGFIGCGALIRKSVYEELGGFADWLFIYTHEFEYSLRALQARWNTVFFEKGTVIHRASKLNRTNKRLRIFGTRNELAIVYKYFTTRRLKYLMRVWLNNMKFIKRDGWLAGWYVMLGVLAFLKLKGTLRQVPTDLLVQEFYAENFWSTKPVFNRRRSRN